MKLHKIGRLAAVSMAMIMGISGVFSGNMANAAGQEANGVIQSDDVQEKASYEVSFKRNASWQGHINGEITIKNNSSLPIKDWKLRFLFDGFIENIWNASVVSTEDEIVISNVGWNQDIAAGEEISFGFIASVESENIKPENMILDGTEPVSKKEERDMDEISSIIQQYVDTIGKDWDSFLGLFNDAQAESLKDFLHDSENQENHEGMLGVISGTLDGWYEVPYEEAALHFPEGFLSDDSRYFVIQAEYEVYKDSECYHKGGESDLMALSKINGDWKIDNFSGYETKCDEIHTADDVEELNLNHLEEGNKKLVPSLKKAVKKAKAKNKHDIPSDNSKIVIGEYLEEKRNLKIR